jgi:tetratricopeptide (TPR) repeat protein
VIRHALLHFLLDPLPLQYPHVVAVKRPLYDLAARASRLSPDLRDDFPSYFAECLVRAVELRLKRLSPSEKEVVLETDDSAGYVLVRPLFNALTKFEESAPSMRLYFPDLVRSIDEGAEEKRVAQIQFAAAPAANADAAASESVARRKFQAPPTLPNDQGAIASLTEGERRIAEKDPQAAEESFKKVLAKYPDQPRALYGMGLAALLEHDGPKAKEVFGRLTTGDHAATQDPLVMAWSHVYLARIYGDEGNMDKAQAEFQAALDVAGGPERAREAAQQGLSAVNRLKSRERP